MMKLFKSKIFRSSLLYGAGVAVTSLLYLAILIATHTNTIVMQLIGVYCISLLAMFLVVQPYAKRSIGLTIGPSMKIGLFGGAFAAVFMLLAEFAITPLIGRPFGPDDFTESGLPYIGLQAMLVFQQIVFGLINSFAMFQYYKKPLEGNEYRDVDE